MDYEILSEAFRRAYIAGRVMPIVADFPPCISRDTALYVYLGHIEKDVRERERGIHCDAGVTVSYTNDGENGCDNATLTYAGDSIAAALPLNTLLFDV